MEHRWGERISMQAPVAIRHLNGDGETAGQLSDLSISGAMVHAGLDVAPCSAVEVRLDGEWITGWVARVEDRAIGVEWMGLSPAAVARRIGGPAWFPESLEHPAVA